MGKIKQRAKAIQTGFYPEWVTRNWQPSITMIEYILRQSARKKEDLDFDDLSRMTRIEELGDHDLPDGLILIVRSGPLAGLPVKFDRFREDGMMWVETIPVRYSDSRSEHLSLELHQSDFEPDPNEGGRTT